MTEGGTKTATFAAGCFWGIEEAFRRIPGVLGTRVGYTGGRTKSPTYEDVCGGATGHAEAVEVTYDPNRVMFEQLLKVFWAVHDPTEPHGPGGQYRSAIFYGDEEQREAAMRSKKGIEESRQFAGEVRTDIRSAEEFWQAEDYHQCYLAKKRGFV